MSLSLWIGVFFISNKGDIVTTLTKEEENS